MDQEYTDNQSYTNYDDEGELSSIPQRNVRRMNEWTKKERILVSSFMLIGFGVLLLGFLQFNSRRTLTVYDVFGMPKQGNSSNATEVSPLLTSSTSGLAQANLQILDTDGDGLTDYDELNKFGTSPYLEDTDSDGIPDKQELDQGDNPNCPKGQTCGFSTTTGQESTATSLEPSDFLLDDALIPDAFGGLSGLEQGLLEGSLNASDLRSLLSQNGASQDLLGQISDQDLEGLYKTTLGRAEEGGLLEDQNNLGLLGDIQNLSVDQIRQMMVEGGLNADEVAGLSDEEVQTIFQQTLNSLGGQN